MQTVTPQTATTSNNSININSSSNNTIRNLLLQQVNEIFILKRRYKKNFKLNTLYDFD